MVFRFALVLLMAVVLSPPVLATQPRGVTIIQDTAGNDVAFYQESYALLVGVSDYTAGWPDLESIPAEIKAVGALLEEQGFHVVIHSNPNRVELEEAFRDFIHDYGFDPQNRLLFFYSGHGETREDGRKGYLVPADAPLPERNLRGFLRKALPMSQIMAWARQIEAKHALFLFDSCFSGTVFKQRSLPETPPHLSALTAKPVRQFITAGSAGETVPANSVFAPVFIDGLKYGLADLDNDGYVTGTEMGVYLQAKVPQHARQTPQFGKIADYELSRGDFVFSLPASHLTSNTRISSAETEERRGTGDLWMPELVFIPAETFDMGEQDARFIENLDSSGIKHYGIPGKKVRINEPFYMSKFEITYDQYDAYVQAQRRSGREIESPETAEGGRGRQPVVHVSWVEAMQYAAWLGEQTERNCCLPTEAEWEYAARAGTQTAYYWGDKLGRNKANCNGCGSQWDNKQAAPVGQFAANDFGLYDMLGNVSEWTCSNWREEFDGNEQQCNDDLSDPQRRVLRGGSWYSPPDFVRSSVRSFYRPDSRNVNIGFRVLCSPPIE